MKLFCFGLLVINYDVNKREEPPKSEDRIQILGFPFRRSKSTNLGVSNARGEVFQLNTNT